MVVVYYGWGEVEVQQVVVDIWVVGGVVQVFGVDFLQFVNVGIFVEDVIVVLGCFDVLVNNVGIICDGFVICMKDEDWDVVL